MTATDDRQPWPTRWFARIASPFVNWSTSRAAYPLGYSPGLDGVRGIMTLGVLGAHTRLTLLPGSIVFMDGFFAMSGYLITSLLLNDYSRHDRIDFRKFYTRRFMRLYPALATMLLIFVLIAALFSVDFFDRLTEATIAFVYLTDYARAFGWPGIWYTGHMWSLAVEEQFYVVWPISLLMLLRWFGLSWRLVQVIIVLAIGFALWRAWLNFSGVPLARLYNAFDTRADALLLGCALAVAMKLIDFDARPQLSKALAFGLLPISLAMLVAVLTVSESMRWYYYAAPLVGALPAAVFTAGLLQKHRTFMHRLYEHPAPVFIGRICYGLYIWHYPVFTLMKEYGASYIQVFLIGWPVVFALATASYYLIERHFMRARPV